MLWVCIGDFYFDETKRRSVVFLVISYKRALSGTVLFFFFLFVGVTILLLLFLITLSITLFDFFFYPRFDLWGFVFESFWVFLVFYLSLILVSRPYFRGRLLMDPAYRKEVGLP